MEKQIDPRILRTRKLIMDAFIELSMKKDFKNITIKDITTAATVNRATFYSHFIDKYDLLEKVISESFMREVIQEVGAHEVINEETIKAIFLSIIKFLTSISNQCQRSYEAFTPQIETIFKMELQAFFSKWAQKQWANQNKTEVEAFTVMLSWALYGAAIHWMQNQTTQPEDYVKQLMHFIKNRINMDKENVI
ncbi:TetR/AcrR family transcriptional regulator [Bacillus sp. 1NLA3E]|uniref:TetR/AcrR family transcriptional regulator n=1 Tax=Bacillus sp. 1NLA3E TaxID=666686 RepID=UPI000247EBF0|nr:TetR/AcrR family transcriptional regulator [Bacillus sp. 1NLA3E]AGK54444.1 transcriptional regulator, TetR family protein [Bacillus sp. 1NLA3E]